MVGLVRAGSRMMNAFVLGIECPQFGYYVAVLVPIVFVVVEVLVVVPVAVVGVVLLAVVFFAVYESALDYVHLVVLARAVVFPLFLFEHSLPLTSSVASPTFPLVVFVIPVVVSRYLQFLVFQALAFLTLHSIHSPVQISVSRLSFEYPYCPHRSSSLPTRQRTRFSS